MPPAPLLEPRGALWSNRPHLLLAQLGFLAHFALTMPPPHVHLCLSPATLCATDTAGVSPAPRSSCFNLLAKPSQGHKALARAPVPRPWQQDSTACRSLLFSSQAICRPHSPPSSPGTIVKRCRTFLPSLSGVFLAGCGKCERLCCQHFPATPRQTPLFVAQHSGCGCHGRSRLLAICSAAGAALQEEALLGLLAATTPPPQFRGRLEEMPRLENWRGGKSQAGTELPTDFRIKSAERADPAARAWHPLPSPQGTAKAPLRPLWLSEGGACARPATQQESPASSDQPAGRAPLLRKNLLAATAGIGPGILSCRARPWLQGGLRLNGFWGSLGHPSGVAFGAPAQQQDATHISWPASSGMATGCCQLSGSARAPALLGDLTPPTAKPPSPLLQHRPLHQQLPAPFNACPKEGLRTKPVTGLLFLMESCAALPAVLPCSS